MICSKRIEKPTRSSELVSIRQTLKFTHLLIGLCVATLLIGCTPTGLPAYIPWKYADLRALDPADASQPSHDLLALYTRHQGDDLQIRLDLLDHATLPDYDLFIALDNGPGGAWQLPLGQETDLEWDRLLVIPAWGALQVLDAGFQPQSGAALHVLRDPIEDSVTISLRSAALGGAARAFGAWPPLQIQVFLTPAGSPALADSLGPVHSDAPPPPPARTLLVFWNAMPAYSPALSLRRWDGAHSGPYGGRHGLYNLLRTARSASMPLVLLDLKAPASLAALSHLGALALVQEMQASGLLILPEYLPDLPYTNPYHNANLAERYLVDNREITRAFDLPTSPFLSTPPGLLPSQAGASLTFLRLSDAPADNPLLPSSTITRWKDQRVIQVPQHGSLLEMEQATPAGPTLELRRILIEAALQNAQAPHGERASLILLGGDLPASAWGAPQAARATFRYFNKHPWIHPLYAHDLLAAQPASVEITPPNLPIIGATTRELFAALQIAPHNRLGQAAWQALQSLYSPAFPQPATLPAIREGYQGVIWSLFHAAEWADNPAAVTSCTLDPDHDGEPECLLASETIYAQFEIESGALTHAFALFGEGSEQAHQLIAPSSQFIVGLSDPATWDFERELGADPAVIPGAFAEIGMHYQPQLSSDPPGLRFVSADGSVQKTFSLTFGGLLVAYDFATAAPFSAVQVPLALDPWGRFSAGWTQRYTPLASSGRWVWVFGSSLRVTLHPTATFSVDTFRDSEQFMGIPEDPNRDVPAGHYLPFPMAQVSIPALEDMRIEFQVNDNP